MVAAEGKTTIGSIMDIVYISGQYYILSYCFILIYLFIYVKSEEYRSTSVQITRTDGKARQSPLPVAPILRHHALGDGIIQCLVVVIPDGVIDILAGHQFIEISALPAMLRQMRV
jgi:hypothetical protein